MSNQFGDCCGAECVVAPRLIDYGRAGSGSILIAAVAARAKP
jgi:hypothetical protein